MGLFSSFIYPSNSFLSWINKSALGLAGVWTFILSYFFAISFRRLLYWTVLSTSKFFPENSHITFYLFSESKKYSAISAVHWNVFFFSLWVSVSLPYVFFFLLRGYRKFWLSTKVSTFSAAILFQGDQRSWIPEFLENSWNSFKCQKETLNWLFFFESLESLEFSLNFVTECTTDYFMLNCSSEICLVNFCTPTQSD